MNILNKNGKIIFLHSLVNYGDSDNIFYKIKPYLKYVPFVWIDSGIPTKKIYFEIWLKSHKLNFTYDITRTDKVFNTNINTYIYVCQT
jgi:hypothetical protein